MPMAILSFRCKIKRRFSIFFMAFLLSMAINSTASLKLGYHRSRCPSAESILRKVVRRAIRRDPGVGPALLRLHFHDCFVRGCDASILLDSTPGNPSEKEDPANGPSLRGFEVIDEAKFELERNCPQTVSCADILAYAARETVKQLGGIDYRVPAGRRDGRVSIKGEPTHNLPRAIASIEEMQRQFASKGLSIEDMVVLSGAHSVGEAECSVISDRLYPANATNVQNPLIDPTFADRLRGKCSASSSNFGPNSVRVPLDELTPNRLDNKFYRNLENGRGLLASDQALMNSPSTSWLVRRYARYGRVWMPKFVDAMVRMGSIEVLSGNQGEIRRNCRMVNLH